MDIPEASLTINGSYFHPSESYCTYAWIRGGEWLYVGASSKGLTRPFSHNIIGKMVDQITSKDEIRVWQASDWMSATLLEARLNNQFSPKYSRPLDRASGVQVDCPKCGVSFVKKRFWQRFCSTKCRTGRGPISMEEDTPNAQN